MKQTPAAILVMCSSILAFGLMERNQVGSDTATNLVFVLIGLGALCLGLWGVISLVNATPVRDRRFLDMGPRWDRRTHYDQSVTIRADMERRPEPNAYLDGFDFDLAPELKAHISMVARREGRERKEIIEELLRKNLPKYGNATSNVA